MHCVARRTQRLTFAASTQHERGIIMSNVIQFLEALGSNPASTRLSAAEYSAAVAALDVEDLERQALVDRDQHALSGLLGGRYEMMCILWPADEPAKEDQPDEEAPLEATPPEQE